MKVPFSAHDMKYNFVFYHRDVHVTFIVKCVVPTLFFTVRPYLLLFPLHWAVDQSVPHRLLTKAAVKYK